MRVNVTFMLTFRTSWSCFDAPLRLCSTWLTVGDSGLVEQDFAGVG